MDSSTVTLHPEDDTALHNSNGNDANDANDGNDEDGINDDKYSQTRLPLASLDFGDRDLTDGFTDVRDGTHSSISGFGHPRGSTPISVLSSRRSTTSTALSGESPESRRVLPNMSALLDFLDNDNTNPFPQTSSSNRKQVQAASHRSSRSPPQPSPALHPHPPRNSLTPRPMPADADLTSNFLHTYDRTNPFRGALPASSTPFTNHRDDFSEMSSPLNKRHNVPSGLPANISPIQFAHQMAAAPTSNSSAHKHASENRPRHHSPRSERPVEALPLETPARLPAKAPSAADRMAAAVMEGAPESHWTFLMERGSSENTAGIRRSKVVEELLQPMRPSISSPDKQITQIPEATGSIKDSDLPQSLLDELSHIRSDQLEKANLVSALNDARKEVASLTEEVRLLRIGVQKLTSAQTKRKKRRCHC
ncbi:hypothetical protein PtB15_8B257 [Puccinia triticina]|nr:hypothetical protein PtB15_8B257 [Puccinia triticina]